VTTLAIGLAALLLLIALGPAAVDPLAQPRSAPAYPPEAPPAD
jgi:hypothetical protein